MLELLHGGDEFCRVYAPTAVLIEVREHCVDGLIIKRQSDAHHTGPKLSLVKVTAAVGVYVGEQLLKRLLILLEPRVDPSDGHFDNLQLLALESLCALQLRPDLCSGERALEQQPFTRSPSFFGDPGAQPGAEQLLCIFSLLEADQRPEKTRRRKRNHRLRRLRQAVSKLLEMAAQPLRQLPSALKHLGARSCAPVTWRHPRVAAATILATYTGAWNSPHEEARPVPVLLTELERAVLRVHTNVRAPPLPPVHLTGRHRLNPYTRLREALPRTAHTSSSVWKASLIRPGAGAGGQAQSSSLSLCLLRHGRVLGGVVSTAAAVARIVPMFLPGQYTVHRLAD